MDAIYFWKEIDSIRKEIEFILNVNLVTYGNNRFIKRKIQKKQQYQEKSIITVIEKKFLKINECVD